MTEDAGVCGKDLSKITTINMFFSSLHHYITDESSWSVLTDLWASFAKSPLPRDSLKSYSMFLGKINVVYENNLEVPLKPTNIKCEAKKVSALVKDYIEEQKELSDKFEQKYSWFRSSWLLADILEHTYPEEIEPGRIIAEFLKLLFPEGVEPLRVTYENSEPKLQVSHGTPFHNLISKIGFSVIETSYSSAIGKECLCFGLHCILNPVEKVDLPINITFDIVVKEIIYAPTEFFLSWTNSWWLYFGDYDDDNNSPDMTVSALNILLESCKLSLPISFEYNGKKSVLTPHILGCLFKKINISGCDLSEHSLEVKLTDLINQYRDLRRNVYCGVSPLGFTTAFDLAYVLESNGYDIKKLDFTSILAGGFLDFGNIYLYPENKEPVHCVDEFNSKQAVYLVLFDKALEEGFFELANALISLYLMARALFCQCRFPVSKELQRAISTGLSLPGFRTLKHTLETIIGWSEKYFPSEPLAKLSVKIFKQFLPKQASLHLINNQGPTESKKNSAIEKEVEASFVEQLGQERWNKLSGESKRQLKSAEVLWRRCYADFGFGVQDWSGLVNNYCKVIEKELTDKLCVFYASEEYKVFYETRNHKAIPRHPTTGLLLKELQYYEKLPIGLQELLNNSSQSIHKDKKLSSQLQKLVDFRNQAAHKEEFDMVKYAEFKKLYFSEKVIHRFIDCLS
jgi:hypothetical protein